MVQRETVMERRARRASMCAGAVSAAIGGYYLVAWLTGQMYYRGAQTITIKTNASLCLVLCGVAVGLVSVSKGGGTRRRVAQAISALAMTIGALTIAEHLGGWDLGIDQLLAKESPGALGVLRPNRMGPPGALSFALGGAGILLLTRKGPRAAHVAQGIGVAVFLIGLLTFLGYFYGSTSLYGVARYTGIAWPTTVAIILLGLAIVLARPGEGMIAEVTSSGPGGTAARRLLPAAVVLPIVFGWLRLQGEWMGLYQRLFGTSILVLSWISAFSFLAYQTAKWVNRSGEALRLSEMRYRSFVQASSQVVWRVNPEGAADVEMPEWQAYTGQSREESRDFGWMSAIRVEDRPKVEEAWKKACEVGSYEVEYLLRRHDGEWRHFLSRGIPIRNADGTIEEWIGTGIDVTEQMRAVEALREKERQFRQLAEALPQLVWVSSPDGLSTYQNAKWYEYTGASRESSLVEVWSSFLHPDDLPRALERWHTSLDSGDPYEDEYRIRRADGEFHWFIARALPVRNEAGEITRWFGTCTDIQEHKMARELAEAAAKAKADFMANMSHEIRTPMNGVIGVTDLLLQTEVNELQRQYLMMVKISADALLSVVNDILDFSKLEAGAGRLDEVDFNLHETVENVAEALSVIGFQKGLEFAVAIDPAVPEHFRGDPAKMRQVLMNLIGNAVKFTDAGEVAVRVEGEPRESGAWRLTFSIKDTGIGIPEEQQGLLFRSFTQLDPSAARAYGGTGLGLAISRRIIELMGGGIRVESSPGAGSTFTFEVELAPVAETTPPRYVVEGLAGRALVVDDNHTNRLMMTQLLQSYGLEVDGVGGGNDGVRRALDAADAGRPYDFLLIDAHLPDLDGYAVAQRLKEKYPLKQCALLMIPSNQIVEGARRVHELGLASYLVKPIRSRALQQALVQTRGASSPGERDDAGYSRASSPFDLLCTRVLVAEDNPVNLTVTEALLRSAGARVTTVTNGREAVDACRGGNFSVVLMDVQMPEMDGLEATRTLRAEGITVPIIGLTAHALDGDREKFVAAGMDDYLSKPVTAEALHEKVAYWSLRKGCATSDVNVLLDVMGGDRETVAIVVTTFLEHAPGQLADVITAVEAEDPDRLEKAAHRLKGALAVVTAESARCMAEKLEQCAKRGDLAEAGDLAAHLESEVGRVLERLQELAKEGDFAGEAPGG